LLDSFERVPFETARGLSADPFHHMGVAL
jgi:hypothetical protein